jgi:hypothetical protein
MQTTLDYYLRASGATDQKQKRAILLHLAGPDVQEIFETLPNTGDDFKTALERDAGTQERDGVQEPRV